MPDFGLRVTNTNNQIQVDSTFMNVNVIRRGIANLDTWVNFPVSAADAMVFLKIPPSVQYSASGDAMIYGVVDQEDTNPSNSFAYSGRFTGVSYLPTVPTLEYAICTVGVPESPPAGSFGMRVRDAQGRLCFNSLYNQPKIVSVASGTVGNYGDVAWLDLTMPDNSQNFWVTAPLGGLLADGWYDGTQEFLDVYSLGIGWLNANTIRMITNVQTFYPTGFGGRIVTHQDCYGATVGAMAARI